ncbi:MAG: 30S ribosomal protein S4 [Nanoarchaeota archaeon]|nr:30S ribosomal protein S4 [Nanoarchaeota archaeon]MBU4086004.1 30S ribosomal protein S4 [Nanoarchaeota archaeon]
MIRKHKRYSRPRKAYDINRIGDENKLVARYGLKNKREIWKAEAKIDNIRGQAKTLITASQEEQQKLIDKLNKIGLNVGRIADILALKKEDWLKRRLQSVLIEKNLAKTPKGARQMIAHKHVAISGNIVNIPSYVVPVEEEDKIEIVRLKTREMRKVEKKDVGRVENG